MYTHTHSSWSRICHYHRQEFQCKKCFSECRSDASAQKFNTTLSFPFLSFLSLFALNSTLRVESNILLLIHVCCFRSSLAAIKINFQMAMSQKLRINFSYWIFCSESANNQSTIIYSSEYLDVIFELPENYISRWRWAHSLQSDLLWTEHHMITAWNCIISFVSLSLNGPL